MQLFFDLTVADLLQACEQRQRVKDEQAQAVKERHREDNDQQHVLYSSPPRGERNRLFFGAPQRQIMVQQLDPSPPAIR